MERSCIIKEFPLPPMPWSYEFGSNGFMYILDNNNRKIASLLGRKEEKIGMALLLEDETKEQV